MIKKNDGEIIISKKLTFLLTGTMSVFLFASGATLFFSDLSLEEATEPADIFGNIFMLLWLGVMGYFILFSFNEFFKKTAISKEGVLCKSFFGTKEYMWSEIKDFGISYSGQTRGEGNTYYLYFSTDILKQNRKGKKKMNRSVIKVIFTSDDSDAFINEVIPFCRESTNVVPFLPSGKFSL
ncbi:MAG: hypothetical protein IJN88_04665 [Clostridia bacterium]|nr:hypothetical protein [Clostridia bacterium]